MSFILDALRKSEHERQRTAMPGIAQVPFGLPRREMPSWAVALIVVLALALLALGGAWWRSTRPDSSAPLEAIAPPQREIPLALPPAPAPTAGSLPAQLSASNPPAPRTPSAASRTTASDTATARAAAPAAASTGAPAATPRAAPAATPAATAQARDATAEETTLPSPAALAAEGITLPTLRLELHGFAARPADRFVFINGTKYVEGATLAEGPKLVAIAPNGAVLTYLGHRFLLSAQ